MNKALKMRAGFWKEEGGAFAMCEERSGSVPTGLVKKERRGRKRGRTTATAERTKHFIARAKGENEGQKNELIRK